MINLQNPYLLLSFYSFLQGFRNFKNHLYSKLKKKSNLSELLKNILLGHLLSVQFSLIFFGFSD